MSQTPKASLCPPTPGLTAPKNSPQKKANPAGATAITEWCIGEGGVDVAGRGWGGW